MKYSESRTGRVFIVRLEDGDILHESVEKLAREKQIHSATVIAVGGADGGSTLVVGPEESRSAVINPMELKLDDAHEIAGVGTIFPNSDGQPILHMHLSAGRKDKSVTGCVRRGVKTWHVLEVIITELLDSSAKRLPDKATGFELLVP